MGRNSGTDLLTGMMYSFKTLLTKPIKPFWSKLITTVAGFFSGFKIVKQVKYRLF
jgi:hypothetical protein